MDVNGKVLDATNLDKLLELKNQKVLDVIETFLKLCKPTKATVITDSPGDIAYIRQVAIDNSEEKNLAMQGHTIHYDSYFDQARDKANTRVLLEKGGTLSRHINSIDRDEGLEEILTFFDGSMKGKEVYIRFFCLGPTDSVFSIPAMQITDSAYVAHSEDLLYRAGYAEFKRLKGSPEFFYFIHSAGELVNNVTKNIPKRRIYIDLKETRVLSVNNQYAGNSIGLKKLALRLAISKAVNEDWLTEHMFMSAVYPPDKSRKTYFLGAFPSACGKTSTAMIPGNEIIGDDIAYIRINETGEARAVNIENGIFGIIKDVNPVDDPLIYQVLTSPRETIFSNVLINNGTPYWLGVGKETPTEGNNHSGEWIKGKKSTNGLEIPLSHPNARYTIKMADLENCDEKLEDPDGVMFEGILYGGRDSDTSVPVYQTFNWEHGVFTGGSLESETTSATLGAEGVRKHQPMANLDFIVVPLANYLQAHFDFVKKLANLDQIKVFSTNYFLKDEKGNYYDDKVDKKIWLIWAEGRIHGDFDAITTPIGHIPIYEDLAKLFQEVISKKYPLDRYEAEFSIRTLKWLDKLDRIEKIFEDEPGTPVEFSDELNNLRKRLVEAQKEYGMNIPPSSLR